MKTQIVRCESPGCQAEGGQVTGPHIYVAPDKTRYRVYLCAKHEEQATIPKIKHWHEQSRVAARGTDRWKRSGPPKVTTQADVKKRAGRGVES